MQSSLELVPREQEIIATDPTDTEWTKVAAIK